MTPFNKYAFDNAFYTLSCGRLGVLNSAQQLLVGKLLRRAVIDSKLHLLGQEGDRDSEIIMGTFFTHFLNHIRAVSLEISGEVIKKLSPSLLREPFGRPNGFPL